MQINQIPNAEFTPETNSGGERVKQHLLFMNIGQKHFYQRLTGQLFFFAIISYGASIFLCKHLSLSCHMVNLLLHQYKIWDSGVAEAADVSAKSVAKDNNKDASIGSINSADDLDLDNIILAEIKRLKSKKKRADFIPVSSSLERQHGLE